MKTDKQVKSKKRVADHGEVFTNEREVNAMLDLVKHETERIDSTFLEPACGNGNFLTEILRRKLKVVADRYKHSQIEFERYAFLAVSSIYGIDLLLDNVVECRHRLLQIFCQFYNSLFQPDANSKIIKSIRYVLSKNIIHGDALTLKTAGLIKDFIVFSEWKLISGNLVVRRDFKFKSLLENRPLETPNLFSDLGEDAFIPTPVQTFKPISLYQIATDEQLEL
ncbi:MAG: SAM-dependent DNA methyltransferase [Sphingobacteriales bacterium]|nr:MAG: SAM-dependent DNA methyltransferase [Sphingobacteriales bacterium]